MKAGTGKLLIAAILVIALSAAAGYAEKAAWFDMEKCEACRHLASKPELMQNMKFETLKISDGIVTIYSVASEKLADYRAAHKEMRDVMHKAMGGGEVSLCGFCQAMARLVKEGATREYVETSNGGLCLITSGDPKVQEKIWGFHEKNQEMMKPPEEKKKEAPAEG